MSLNWRFKWLFFQQRRPHHHRHRPGFSSAMFSRRCFVFRLRRAAIVVLIVVFAIYFVVSNSFSTSNDELSAPMIGLFDSFQSAVCVESFLGHYEEVCQRVATKAPHAVVRQRAMSTIGRRDPRNDVIKELCPCVPRQSLTGRIDPYKTAEQSFVNGVDHGGHWSPVHCIARQRLAIIIPFRNREAHLHALLHVLHPMLQRQLVDYTIFVIEQEGRYTVFNKGSLMNVGFLESRARATADNLTGPFDCYVFHDVDMLPGDDRNLYGCGLRSPRHLGTYIDKYNYTLDYPQILGGVTAYHSETFQLLNGFSNRFYGWGGEDDDMFYRIKAHGLTFIRYAKCVARYSMIKHGHDEMNPENPDRFKLLNKTRYHDDGLNTVRYKIMLHEQRPLYTWLLVSLPPGKIHSD